MANDAKSSALTSWLYRCRFPNLKKEKITECTATQKIKNKGQDFTTLMQLISWSSSSADLCKWGYWALVQRGQLIALANGFDLHLDLDESQLMSWLTGMKVSKATDMHHMQLVKLRQVAILKRFGHLSEKLLQSREAKCPGLQQLVPGPWMHPESRDILMITLGARTITPNYYGLNCRAYSHQEQ